MTTAIHFLPGDQLEKIAPGVKSRPRLEATPEATTHMQRSRWARKSRRTRSQALLLSPDDKREAVALAVLARLWPSVWTVKELADHCGLPVCDVDAVVAEWENDGLVLRSPAGMDFAMPRLLEKLGVRK